MQQPNKRKRDVTVIQFAGYFRVTIIRLYRILSGISYHDVTRYFLDVAH